VHFPRHFIHSVHSVYSIHSVPFIQHSAVPPNTTQQTFPESLNKKSQKAKQSRLSKAYLPERRDDPRPRVHIDPHQVRQLLCQLIPFRHVVHLERDLGLELLAPLALHLEGIGVGGRLCGLPDYGGLLGVQLLVEVDGDLFEEGRELGVVRLGEQGRVRGVWGVWRGGLEEASGDVQGPGGGVLQDELEKESLA
jgi:hypothetical protein